ncbi:transglycosylase domain-containing protein [Bacillus horti]|uniref:Penicillin-binding protein 2A n=1 Tax=Caldalkalibacillus horti TaxID=77523 RepID=A0ABT9W043_9BACI|nr:PBP1A family penicillin-binding protein [Bacillus horti]MDQ0166626.1 penicillin-binding protein 2A [Bacillus horti]
MSKKKKKKINIKVVTLSVIGVFFLVGIVLAAFMGFILVQNYEIDETKLEMMEATILFDQQGNEATKLYTQNREYVSIDQMPQELLDAFVTIEDQRFYEHGGIDFRAIARALYRDIIARSFVEGGSTITQQLAKNVFLSHEKKLLRKTEEVLIAINLEKQYTKDEILEMYLNYIYFGHGAHGISAAAQVYFNKEVEDLNLTEIGLLAALPRGPGLYSPFIEGNEERSEQRRKLVIREMYNQGRISEADRDEALEAPLELTEVSNSSNPAMDTFIDMVIREAQNRLDVTQDDIFTGGYKIYTTLDMKAQEAMYEAINKDSAASAELFPESSADQIIQGSMVIMDHSTGGVSAVIGGRDYVRTGTNRATANVRSPGSTFKPIAAYAPALEMGWNPYDLIVDEQMSFGNYSPRNYDNVYRGRVTMIDAIRQSYNIPAVWTLNEIGVDRGVQSANDFGIENLNRELGIALGGSVQTSPMGMATAFGVFANEGVKIEPYMIERIVDRNGREVYTNQLNHTQVISAQSAWYMTKMLQRVVQDGTGTRGQLSHDIAAKTGTTQGAFGNGGATDAWFVGYTPKYVAAVWMGYDSVSENHIMQTSGGNHPARVFKYVMDRVLEGQEPLRFQRPEGVSELVPPVRLQPIQDLQAFLNVTWDMEVSVDLDFTPNEDDRVGYRIYRLTPGTEDRQMLAEIGKGELVDGRRWSDTNVSFNDLQNYQVVPYNMDTGQEGDASNVASVQINPGQFEGREGVEYDDDFAEWLQDLIDSFNGGGNNGQGNDEEEENEGNENGNGNGNNGNGDGNGPPDHSNGNPDNGDGEETPDDQEEEPSSGDGEPPEGEEESDEEVDGNNG